MGENKENKKEKGYEVTNEKKFLKKYLKFKHEKHSPDDLRWLGYEPKDERERGNIFYLNKFPRKRWVIGREEGK